MVEQHIQVDDLKLLIQLLPQRLTDYLDTNSDLSKLIEVVMDKGHPAEVRMSNVVHRLKDLGDVTQEDIDNMVKKIGEFNTDNRAGIERTLHRVSAIKNRSGDVIGLTCRVGRAVVGTVDIIKDIVENGQNCLFLGPPGIGKTTILRETARVLADEANKRVVVVDTSNEIAGDGDIPHPGIGYARRMQVPSPDKQHAIMIEAVENHMPEVIIVDEIGTEAETIAARTIAERGVQLVATAHGYNLQSLIKNPILSDLIGGVQTVVIGDEEAKFRGTSKSVLERKSLPTFDVVVEIRSRDVFAIYNPVATNVDAILIGDPLVPEVRTRESDGDVMIEASPKQPQPIEDEATHPDLEQLVIFPFGINTDQIITTVHALQVPVRLAKDIGEADIVLTLKSKVKAKSKINQIIKGKQIPLHVINSPHDVSKFLKDYYKLVESDTDTEEEALREVEKACKRAIEECRVVELTPRTNAVRRLQHRITFDYGLNSMSVGEDPNRRLRVYPRA